MRACMNKITFQTTLLLITILMLLLIYSALWKNIKVIWVSMLHALLAPLNLEKKGLVLYINYNLASDYPNEAAKKWQQDTPT